MGLRGGVEVREWKIKGIVSMEDRKTGETTEILVFTKGMKVFIE